MELCTSNLQHTCEREADSSCKDRSCTGLPSVVVAGKNQDLENPNLLKQKEARPFSLSDNSIRSSPSVSSLSDYSIWRS